jgi:hypothetical protein
MHRAVIQGTIKHPTPSFTVPINEIIDQINMRNPAHNDVLAELAYWERNQFRICISQQTPEPPPNIPELLGLLDYFKVSKDYYAVAQRINELKRIAKKIGAIA